MNEIQNDSSLAYYLEDDCDRAAECSNFDVVEEESAWTRTTIGLLLEECLKKKKDLHNPRHRRNRFFGHIREQLTARGYLFSVKALEKKFYNLKKTFHTICQNRDRGTSPMKPITWPYYEQMMGIFAEELEIEDAPTMASLYPEMPPPRNAVIVQTVEPERKEDPVEGEDPHDKHDDVELGDEESTWTHKSVLAFLQECCRQKYDLWDPMIRRRQIFTDIRKRLAARGYCFYQESLDRKLRNMKKQFQVVSESMKKKNTTGNGRRRRFTWPYYEQLKEIYGKEMEREVRRKRGVQKKLYAQSAVIQPLPATPTKYRPIAPKPISSTVAADSAQNSQGVAVEPAVLQNPEDCCFPKNDDIDMKPSPTDYLPPAKLRKVEISPASPGDLDRSNASSDFQRYEAALSDHIDDTKWPVSAPSVQDDTTQEQEQEQVIDFQINFREKPSEVDERLKFTMDILALEERRTIVAEEMAKELVEANKIREKRLEFNRIKLDYANAKRRRKKNGSV